MKKVKYSLFFLFIIILSFILMPKEICAKSDDLDNEEKMEIIDEQIDSFDLDEFSEISDSLKEDNKLLEDYSIKQLIKDMMNSDIEFSFTSIVKEFLKILFSEILNHIYLMRKILLICILSALMTTLTESFESKAVAEIGFYASYIVLIIVIFEAFKIASLIVFNTTNTLVTMIYALIPIFVAFYALGGFAATAAIINPLIIAAVHFVSVVIKNVILPLISFSALLQIVNYLSEAELLDKLSELFKKLISYILKALAFLTMSVLSLQSLGAPVLNRALNNSTKALVKTVPIVGDVLSGSVETVMGLATAVKTGTTAAVIIFFVLSASIPLIKLLAMLISFKLTAAMVEPIADKRIVSCIDCIGDYTGLLLASIFVVLLIFIFILFVVLLTSKMYI